MHTFVRVPVEVCVPALPPFPVHIPLHPCRRTQNLPHACSESAELTTPIPHTPPMSHSCSCPCSAGELHLLCRPWDPPLKKSQQVATYLRTSGNAYSALSPGALGIADDTNPLSTQRSCCTEVSEQEVVPQQCCNSPKSSLPCSPERCDWRVGAVRHLSETRSPA